MQLYASLFARQISARSGTMKSVNISHLEFKNRDTKRMPATLRAPEAPPKGTLLVLHGLAGWKDQPCVATVAEGAVRAGYQALTFEAADGAKAPDADFVVATTTGYVQDVEDVITQVLTETWFVPPLLLAGHSQGGLVALTVASRREDVASLILFAPVVSWKTDWSLRLVRNMRLGKLDPRFKEKPHITLFPKWVIDFFSFDARTCAPHVHARTLIISAGRDQFVAPERVHARLAALMPEATHRIIVGAKHEFLGHLEELAGIVEEWLSSS